MNRKSQIHMTETIAVLFIFFILILFGIVFYYNYSKTSLKEKQQEWLATQAMDTTLSTLYLPELICSKGEAEPEANCFDLSKLRYVNSTFTKYYSDYYFDLFSYATITVHQLYPPKKDYVLYDHLLPKYTSKEPTYYVVALRNSNPAAYYYGYLQVEVYS